MERAVTLKLKANLLATRAQSCVSSGTNLTTQFPSHGLGEPVAYGFQTLAQRVLLYSVVVKNMKFYRHEQDSNPDRCSEYQTC